MLQKELPEGLADEECGGQVENGHAGLCVYVRGGRGTVCERGGASRTII